MCFNINVDCWKTHTHAQRERGEEREGEGQRMIEGGGGGKRYSKAVIEIKANYNWCVSSRCPSRCTLCLLCKTAWCFLRMAAAEFVFRFFYVLFSFFVWLCIWRQKTHRTVYFCVWRVRMCPNHWLRAQRWVLSPTFLLRSFPLDHHVVLCWLVERMMKTWNMNGC